MKHRFSLTRRQRYEGCFLAKSPWPDVALGVVKCQSIIWVNAKLPNDLTPNYRFLNLDLTKENEINNKRDGTNGYAPYTNKKQKSPQSDFQVGS